MDSQGELRFVTNASLLAKNMVHWMKFQKQEKWLEQAEIIDYVRSFLAFFDKAGLSLLICKRAVAESTPGKTTNSKFMGQGPSCALIM